MWCRSSEICSGVSLSSYRAAGSSGQAWRAGELWEAWVTITLKIFIHWRKSWGVVTPASIGSLTSPPTYLLTMARQSTVSSSSSSLATGSLPPCRKHTSKTEYIPTPCYRHLQRAQVEISTVIRRSDILKESPRLLQANTGSNYVTWLTIVMVTRHSPWQYNSFSLILSARFILLLAEDSST